jgi:hypothetical protein
VKATFMVDRVRGRANARELLEAALERASITLDDSVERDTLGAAAGSSPA